MFRKLFILLFILSVGFLHNSIIAQKEGFSVDSEITKYRQAANEIFVLRNENAAIPLRGLDTLKINVQLLEADDYLNFQQNLEKYTSLEKSDFLKPVEESINCRIIGLDPRELNTLSAKQLVELEKIMQQEQTITVLFHTAKEKESWPTTFDLASHLLYIKGNTEWHQSLAAQLIFGGVGTSNQLDTALSPAFPTGSGWTIMDTIRLGYGPPGLVGMNSTKLQTEIEAIAREGIEGGAFPGCQVLIAKNGKVIFHESWGHHTYEKKRPVQATDIYDLASVTKISSALPIFMKWHGEGRFDLEAPLSTYFPKFRKSNKAGLSLRTILAHHARLKPWIPYWRSTLKKNGKFKWRTFKRKRSRRFPILVTDQLFLHRKYKKRIYKAIRKSPLNPQGGYKYSGLAFYLFPEIIEKQSGEDYETYLKKSIYHPLGAYTMTYNPRRFFPLKRIVPTERDTFFRMTQIHGRVHDEGAAMMGGVSSNAGLFASANDLAKLMQLYLNEGTYGGEQLIAATSVREFTRCQYCDEDNRRGLGFDKPLIEYDVQKSSVAEAASPSSYGHSGYTGTFAWVDPEAELIFIFCSNRVFPTRDNRKIYEWNIRPRIHTIIYEAME